MSAHRDGGRPSLAVFKFASCDGCQLSILDCEDELLAIARSVEIASFKEMSSHERPGPYDVVLVEGSITTAADAERIREVRAGASTLVAIGACATAGGIQSLRNFAPPGSYAAAVYEHPDYLETSERSTPVTAHVAVDYELAGCPIDKYQLLEVLTAHLAGRAPVVPHHAVCEQCKARGATCVLVSRRVPCLGPVTRAGCGALCPAVGRGCYGCFGPAETANTASLAARLAADGATEASLVGLFRSFNAAAPAFGAESLAHESPTHETRGSP